MFIHGRAPTVEEHKAIELKRIADSLDRIRKLLETIAEKRR